MTEKSNNNATTGFFLLLLATLVGLIIFRVIYSVPIEFNDESILKWDLGRQFLATGDWGLFRGDHHNLRWAVILPQVLVGLLFPTGWFSYYVMPIFFYSVFSVASLGLYRSEKHRVALAAALLVVMIIEPLGHAMASQANSGAFGLLYVICGVYAILAYVKTENRVYLLLAAFGFFFAYGTHLTYAVFAGAPVMFFLFNLRNFRAIVVYSFALLALLGIEALVLYMVSGGEVQGGRLAEVARIKTWGGENSMMGSTAWKGKESYELHHFFDRWRMLPKYSLGLGLMFVIANIGLVSARLRKNLPSGVWLCFYGAGLYGVAVSAPIIGFQPLQLALDLHSRYLAPFFPLASVFIVWVTATVLQHWSSKLCAVFFGVGTVILLGAFLLGSNSYRCMSEIRDAHTMSDLFSRESIYCRSFRYSQEQVVYPAPNVFILRADDYYRSFADDYISGTVALFGHTRIGAFRWFVNAEFPDAKFLETPNGWYSIDGEDKSRCVMELAQTATPDDNYRDCIGKKMERGIFN